MSESKHPGYWWPCFFLYLIWLQSCGIEREVKEIRKELAKQNTEQVERK